MESIDHIASQLLSQNGIIGLLFVGTFFGFMFKGIPYMALKFEEVLTNFKTISFEQNQFFREELKKISDTFITQIQTSNNWHEGHSKKLENQSKQLEEILTRITK